MNEWRFFCANGGNQSCKCEQVWEEKLRWMNPRWPNSRWQNSRWLPSSSWVRMNKFESDWISLNQESEWRESVFEWIWEKKTRCLNPTWQNSRWLPSSSWVRMNKFESDWISLSQESEWSESVFEQIWEKIRKCLNPRWQSLNPTWENSRWLPSSSWVRMNEWSFLNPTW